MSFMRPDAIAWLSRWRGCAIAVATGAGGMALFGADALRGSVFATGLLAATLALALWLFRDGWLRARLSSSSGPGLAAVSEGSVAYFGPFAGGLTELDALVSIEIERKAGVAFWVLRAEGANPLVIPAAAEGADSLLDAFAALPGFDQSRVIRALDAADGLRSIVWRRRAPALATPRRHA
jgi:hypothetical protein